MNLELRNRMSGLKTRLKGIPQELRFKMAKKDKKFRPVFLIGCGRSGTTILGKTLGKHNDIAYLNERRDLWHLAYPELDIWSGAKQAKLYLQKDDADRNKSQKLKKLFYREQTVRQGTVVLEKLPINNFRLNFLHAIFPEAKYVYLHRNGLEVARSISKLVKKGWFGRDNMKLKFLYKYAKRKNIPVPKNESLSDMQKGLLEWRLSIEESNDFFNKLNMDRYVSLSYQSLLDSPNDNIKAILEFLELDYSGKFVEETAQSLVRKNEKINHIGNAEVLELGGDFLIPSINDQYRKEFPNTL